MQASSDIFLGWQRTIGIDGLTRDFYIRQLRDWKGSIEVDTLLVVGMTIFARLCGGTLARAHARSGDRIAIAAYLGSSDAFDRAIADFSTAYADQNEQDYQAMVEAVNSGRLVAETGL
jgi:thiamine monophosphate kinase